MADGTEGKERLGVARGVEKAPAEALRDHSVLFAVQDEKRCVYRSDVVARAVLILHQKTDGRPRIGLPGDVDSGTPVRMVFRVKEWDDRRGFTRYFWKAQPDKRRMASAKAAAE